MHPDHLHPCHRICTLPDLHADDGAYTSICWLQVTRERIRQIEAKALRRLRALQTSGKGRLSEYLVGEMEEKSLAARSSGGLKKQS